MSSEAERQSQLQRTDFAQRRWVEPADGVTPEVGRIDPTRRDRNVVRAYQRRRGDDVASARVDPDDPAHALPRFACAAAVADEHPKRPASGAQLERRSANPNG